MSVRDEYNEKLANTVIGNLKKRQIEAFYCPSAAQARDKALSFVKEGDRVSFGGSMTLEETGILEALRNRGDIRLIDRANAGNPQEMKQVFRDALSADCYFMSTNALTEDGELVNIDGNGNRLAALIYGPDQVVIVTGMNKVVPNVEDAVRRVRHTATPLNCIRLNRNTPCASTGTCADCLASDCICNQVVITRRSGNPDRIKVILVGEALGY
ncbi:MAG: lactate utilization protein [Agathobacter sp.]|nr:lactate utilization protein [Agathobacter sp.]